MYHVSCALRGPRGRRSLVRIEELESTGPIAAQGPVCAAQLPDRRLTLRDRQPAISTSWILRTFMSPVANTHIEATRPEAPLAGGGFLGVALPEREGKGREHAPHLPITRDAFSSEMITNGPRPNLRGFPLRGNPG